MSHLHTTTDSKYQYNLHNMHNYTTLYIIPRYTHVIHSVIHMLDIIQYKVNVYNAHNHWFQIPVHHIIHTLYTVLYTC